MGITSDWQHGFSVHTASTIGSLTHRGFYYMEKKCNRSCRVKKIDESLIGEQGEGKVEDRLRIEGKGTEKKRRKNIRVLEKKGMGQGKGK